MVLALLVTGCSGTPAEIVPPGAIVAADLGSDRDLPRRPWVPDVQGLPGRPGPASKTANLTLREAVERAVAHSATMKAASIEIDARHAEAAQASFRPNPELSLEVENFAGSKSKQGFDAAEETLQLSQVIELGDKRLKRLAAGQLEASLAAWDFEAARVAAAGRAAEAFVDVLAAQERLTVLRDFVIIADKTRSNVDARVKGGKASAIELDRADVAVARARALADAEMARQKAARIKLSALWGTAGTGFEHAAGRLGRDRAAPSIEHVKSLLEGNPSIARWTDEVGRRFAALEVERSKAIPDITVGAGVRQFNEDDSTALVASVSMPLQVFDGNQGSIAAAERRVSKAEFEAEAARNDLLGSLADVLGALHVADAQAKAFESKVLPAATSAFDKTRAGYEEGKFDLLNVLDTQRTLFEARLDLVNALADYEKARVQVEALIGRGLNDI